MVLNMFNIKMLVSCSLFLLLSNNIYAQVSAFQMEYRNRVKEYNQDIKSAGYTVAIQKEKEKSAKADFFPSLSGNADASYTGNPLELSINRASTGEQVTFYGKDKKYGASLTLAQPVYSGGAIKAGYEKAQKEHELSLYEKERIMNNTLYDADVYYWNKVARDEMVGVAEDFQESMSALVDVVKHRVEEEYTDRNDLLMVEVKLNDAKYKLIQARNDAEVARMQMNSFSGIPFNEIMQTDSSIIAISDVQQYAEPIDTLILNRPEIQIAAGKIDIQQSEAKIANSMFMPKLSVGVDGSYSSPGYNFHSDLDPNYCIYAKLSVPIFEWGKRKNTRRVGKLGVKIAEENNNKTIDKVRLEVESAFYTFSQAVQKVVLTENSLSKAAESEQMAMDKYKEGNISIVEVINSQIYHQEAKVNYIQSKLNAQIAKSALDRAVGRINN